MATTENPSTSDRHQHGVLMDQVYRYQRYIYDFTRKYFLLGRDRLIARMDVQPNDTIIEVGCGTARNLIHLARKFPNARFFGIDASQAMLDTAAAKISSRGLSDHIALTHGYAENLDHKAMFDLDEPFDVVFFSYTLTMIPTWQEALSAALANLKPGNRLYIVDFWDQAKLPSLFRFVLKRWLSLFHVRFEPTLMEHLESLKAAGEFDVQVEALYGRYAYLAVIKTPNKPSA